MGIKITLDTSDIMKVAKAFKKESSQLKSQLNQAMRATALDIQSTAKKPGYVPFKTGTLRRSITHKVSSSGNAISALIGSNLVYAAIHEFGGETGRNKSVHIKKSEYIQRAIADNEDELRERIRKALAINALR